MTEESTSLKDEMTAALRGDFERVREKRERAAENPPPPQPQGLLRRLFSKRQV